MMVLIRIFQGVLALLLFKTFIGCIKKYDSENGLPEEMSWKIELTVFCGGGMIFPETVLQILLLILFIAYLASMAYTDFFTQRVYSLFYVLVAIPGYLWLVGEGSWLMLKVVLMYIGFVAVCSFVLNGFCDGDVEVFIAATPYMALLAQRMKQPVLLMLMLFMLVSLLLGIAGSMVQSIRKRKIITKSAMVPYIFGAAICMMALDNIL